MGCILLAIGIILQEFSGGPDDSSIMYGIGVFLSVNSIFPFVLFFAFFSDFVELELQRVKKMEYKSEIDETEELIAIVNKKYQPKSPILLYWQKRLAIAELGDIGTKRAIKALQDVTENNSSQNQRKFALKIIKLLTKKYGFEDTTMFLQKVNSNSFTEIPENTFEQLKSPTFSLWEKTLRTRPSRLFFIVFYTFLWFSINLIIIGVLGIIIGLYITMNFIIGGIIIASLGGVILLSIILKFRHELILYKEIKKYRQLGDREGLINCLKKCSSKEIIQSLAMAALAELGTEKVIEPINKILAYGESPFLRQRARDALDLLSIKLGYKNRFQLLQKGETDEDYPDMKIPMEVVILEGVPEQNQCMITGLQLDRESGDILACPFCGRIARKELLIQWLEEKLSCPVCQRRLLIEQCQIVKFNE